MLRRGGAVLGAVLVVVLVAPAPARADRQRDAQWYFGPMKLVEAQELGNGGAGVTVAVVDTGVDSKHQDLRGATVPGRDMSLNVPANDIDTGPHGTAMAVLIAGRGHGNGAGLLGVAPRSKVMSITPVIDDVALAAGIRWAVEHGAKVINMSFHLDSGTVVRKAIADAFAADVVLVGAVGNENGPVNQPIDFPGVLGVGSVDRSGKVLSFSNHGAGVDLVTYGSALPAALPRNKYETASGTSASSALVAGVAALLRARYPDMSAAEVVDRLTGTATDRGPTGRDNRYGYGELDVLRALTAPRTPATASVAPTATAPPGAPADTPIAIPQVTERRIPPVVIVAVGVLLLIVALAALMIVRARRRG
jgi:subtilisin family serine protease